MATLAKFLLKEQLELRLEDPQSNQAQSTTPPPETTTSASVPTRRPARGPLPAHLPRETHRPEPPQPSWMLEYVPAQFKVVRHVRPKLSCARCERIVQAAAPSRPIERGLAGPGLLAHVLVAKLRRDARSSWSSNYVWAPRGVTDTAEDNSVPDNAFVLIDSASA